MSKTIRAWFAPLLGLAGCALILSAEVPRTLAIRNARIVTVSGPAINRGTVVVRNGLIEAVGENVVAPADAWIIEGEGLTVYPGLIDALSSWGIPDAAPAATPAAGRGGRGAATPGAPTPTPTTPTAPPARGPEDRPQTTSWEHAADLVRPTDRRLEAARNAGYTTAVTFPMRGIFAGQGVVVNLAGETPGQMVVSSPAGMYVGFTTGDRFGGGFPGSLMGIIAYVRQIYLDAEYYRMMKEAYAKNPVGMQRPAYDRALEGVLEAPRVLLPATRAVEMDRMLRFAAEMKLKPVLYGAHEGYRAADMLKKFGVPVLVSLRWPERARDADPEEEEALRVLELRENAPATPAALAKAGVRFAFYSGGLERPVDAWRAVKRAIDRGLPVESALRALTLDAAAIYGVSDRMGSIEKGKIANLIVTKGDLFQDRTQVQHIIVDGVKLQPAPESAPTEEAAR